MLIGLLSDTHGDVDMTAAAIHLLKSKGVQRYLHAGDVGDESVLDLFAGEQLDFVWGNNDLDRNTLAKYAAAINLTCHDNLGKLIIDRRTIVITHGDNRVHMQQSLGNPSVNYLITGHTHAAMDHRIGKVRHINPGALYRVRVKTVATLELSADKLEIMEVRAK